MPGYNRERPGKTKGYAYTGKSAHKKKGNKMSSHNSMSY